MTYTNTLEPRAPCRWTLWLQPTHIWGILCRLRLKLHVVWLIHQRFALNTSRSMRAHKWHTACVRTYVAPWRSRAVFSQPCCATGIPFSAVYLRLCHPSGGKCPHTNGTQHAYAIHRGENAHTDTQIGTQHAYAIHQKENAHTQMAHSMHTRIYVAPWRSRAVFSQPCCAMVFPSLLFTSAFAIHRGENAHTQMAHSMRTHIHSPLEVESGFFSQPCCLLVFPSPLFTFAFAIHQGENAHTQMACSLRTHIRSALEVESRFFHSFVVLLVFPSPFFTFAFAIHQGENAHTQVACSLRTHIRSPLEVESGFFHSLVVLYWYSLLRFLPSPLQSIGGKMRTHKWHAACVRTYVAPWRSRAVFFTALLCYTGIPFSAFYLRLCNPSGGKCTHTNGTQHAYAHT